MNSKTVGERTEAIILAELLKRGEVVLLPFGDNQRYDLVIDRDGKFIRIQCKTGRLKEKEGVVEFRTYSSSVHRKGGSRKDYRGQAEYFGVYCPQIQKSYLVPVEDVGKIGCTLRLRPPLNNQTKKVRWAKDYEL